ncbi:hypothetical protein C1H71_01995 [Iodobacter fluviatilis]|uniref:Uncharacterized protein n=1 Tax=Iodobacter fluviatilis TaxID=537 RepID=A0A7G3G5N9_9NEIS|nr:hypothetical protein C1H71_01995 [Iodobacter fluviatilis]
MSTQAIALALPLHVKAPSEESLASARKATNADLSRLYITDLHRTYPQSFQSTHLEITRHCAHLPPIPF